MQLPNRVKNVFIGIGALIACLVSGLVYHEVDNYLTEEDRNYIPIYLANITPLSKKRDFQDELTFILQVQSSVLNIASLNKGLPFNKEREPKDVYLAKTGLCYDRSRVIEKILRFSGFETRHIAIYSTMKTGSPIRSILTPGVSSHAVAEVLTKRGWMVVDSNNLWVSIDQDRVPKSIEQIQLGIENSSGISWNKKPPTFIYEEPFTYIYGLYSRHGKFYPPFNFIPDVNYRELMQNIL